MIPFQLLKIGHLGIPKLVIRLTFCIVTVNDNTMMRKQNIKFSYLHRIYYCDALFYFMASLAAV